MDKLLAFWLFAFTLGISAWLYIHTGNMEIDYKRHSYLIDPVSKVKRKPSELLQLNKIINLTSQYINSTNAQERLYDLEYQLNLENPFIFDQGYSDKLSLALSAWPVANQTACASQLSWILDRLSQHQNYTYLRGQLGYELTRYTDSFGRPESGVYAAGVTNWLGSYRACRQASLNNGRIKTRYCIARMRARSWPKNEKANPPTSIRVGMCLPESCDTSSFDGQRSRIETLAKLELPQLYKDELELQSIFCLPDERSPIRQIPFSGQIYLVVVMGWLALVISATILYELNRTRRREELAYQGQDTLTASTIIPGESKLNQFRLSLTKQEQGQLVTNGWSQEILDALSIRESIKAFKMNTFRVRYKQGQRVRVNLAGIDLFKVVMAILVILAHAGYLANAYARSLTNRVEMLTSDLALLAVSISRAVDLFFVFFGLLTTYTLMKKLSLRQLSNPLMWLGVNVGISLRIAPLFMLVYWYSKSISPYTGAGPWWDYGVDENTMKGVCMRDSWWKSIPLLGSIGTPAVPSCVLPAWFLVSYSHISLILPLLTYIICKLTSRGRIAMIAYLSIVSALSTAYRLYSQSTVPAEAFQTYGALLSDLLEKFEATGHLTTLGRVGCVSVGSLVGYLLRSYEIGEITRWPKWLCHKITIIITILLHVLVVFLPLLGKRIYQVVGGTANLETIVTVDAIVTIIFPIMNAILIINAATVHNHKVLVRFAGHTFWHIFNRLGLCIYLIHWEVLFIAVTGFEQAPSYGFMMDVMKLWSFGVFVSIVLAFFIHILIEAPLSRILILVGKSFTKGRHMQGESHGGTSPETQTKEKLAGI